MDDAGPITPLVLLPGQLPARRSTDSEADHCLNLYRHVLLSALEDLDSPRANTRSDASRWLRYPDIGTPISLRMCCDTLGLDPRLVSRRALHGAGLA